MGSMAQRWEKNRKAEWIMGISTVVIGTSLHFLYEWTGKSPAVAWLAAIDESVWEHLKMLFQAFTLFTLFIVYYWGIKYLTGRLLGVVSGCLFICAIFYLYTLGGTRPSLLAIDISTFILAIVLACWVASQVTVENKTMAYGAGSVYFILWVLFVLFSYIKPTTQEPFALPHAG